jgi:hypothetical protein
VIRFSGHRTADVWPEVLRVHNVSRARDLKHPPPFAWLCGATSLQHVKQSTGHWRAVWTLLPRTAPNRPFTCSPSRPKVETHGPVTGVLLRWLMLLGFIQRSASLSLRYWCYAAGSPLGPICVVRQIWLCPPWKNHQFQPTGGSRELDTTRSARQILRSRLLRTGVLLLRMARAKTLALAAARLRYRTNCS